MKALFSEEYYDKYWDEFLEPALGEHYINLEASLAKEMAHYDSLGLGEKEIFIIRKIEAQKLADECRELVLKERDVVKSIESGESSFGMTTKFQEIKKRGEFRKRFEFNCLQMRRFKEKYGLV